MVYAAYFSSVQFYFTVRAKVYASSIAQPVAGGTTHFASILLLRRFYLDHTLRIRTATLCIQEAATETAGLTAVGCAAAHRGACICLFSFLFEQKAPLSESEQGYCPDGLVFSAFPPLPMHKGQWLRLRTLTRDAFWV